MYVIVVGELWMSLLLTKENVEFTVNRSYLFLQMVRVSGGCLVLLLRCGEIAFIMFVLGFTTV